jgi:protein-disulfide isomerase
VNKKAWIIFIAVVVLLMGALVYLSSKNKINVSKVQTAQLQPAAADSGNIADHVFGKADSKVILTEYGDYQCPGCGGVYPKVKALTDKYQGQIAFVFRNFPLTTLHPNARAAAATAEAAGLQGKYWEMHDKLYENQSAWENITDLTQRTNFFTDYAKQLGLDTTKFTTDIASSQVNQKINYDLALGRKDGVSGTPSFYLNGTVINQDVWGDATKFENAVKAELQKQGIALPDAK